jgi:hypothetical protein
VVVVVLVLVVRPPHEARERAVEVVAVVLVLVVLAVRPPHEARERI